MSIKFSSIYRDVNQTLSSEDIWSESLYHNDTVKAINDAIASIRIEYIGNGLGHEFAETESIYVYSDFQYPFYVGDLSKPLLRSLPIYQTVRTTSFPKSSTEVKAESASYAKGDKVIYDNNLYKVTNDVTADITGLTFETKDLRYYFVGLKAFVGDVIVKDDKYFKCNTAYTIQQGDDLSTVSEFDQVYLKKIGRGYEEGMYVDFSRLHELSLNESVKSNVFTIKDSKVYTTIDSNFVITYIPEWTQVTDLSTELNIPDTMVSSVKQQALASLARNIGVQIDTEE